MSCFCMLAVSTLRNMTSLKDNDLEQLATLDNALQWLLPGTAPDNLASQRGVSPAGLLPRDTAAELPASRPASRTRRPVF